MTAAESSQTPPDRRWITIAGITIVALIALPLLWGLFVYTAIEDHYSAEKLFLLETLLHRDTDSNHLTAHMNCRLPKGMYIVSIFILIVLTWFRSV